VGIANGARDLTFRDGVPQITIVGTLPLESNANSYQTSGSSGSVQGGLCHCIIRNQHRLVASKIERRERFDRELRISEKTDVRINRFAEVIYKTNRYSVPAKFARCDAIIELVAIAFTSSLKLYRLQNM
jgi:hypothetical protein